MAALNFGAELQKLRVKQTKNCPVCGQEFTGYSNAETCSGKCRIKKHRESKKMNMSAVLINTDNQIISDDDIFINSDKDFDAIEQMAKESCVVCAIRWSRSTDGQIAYWTPAGASLQPHWYNAERS